jgi:AP2 domain.
MELMISSGYRYDAQSGNIYGMNGKLITKKSRSGYIICYKNIRGHRFAWYYTYGEIPNIIDHINRVRDDNRICNLRNVDRAQNNKNSTRIENAKLYAHHKQTGKYTAQICINYKKIHIGIFDTKEEAIKARLEYEDRNGL